MSFSITRDPIDGCAQQALLEDPGAGAMVCFEGWVRNHSEGQPVENLEYDVYEALAVAEGERIIGEARERFEIANAVCVHRVGLLAIGDCAVWVGVSSAHRGPAFDACRYVIDEVKARVPIWKSEQLADGTKGWVNDSAPVPEPVPPNTG